MAVLEFIDYEDLRKTREKKAEKKEPATTS
jgi:hypothetical protein